MDERRSRRTHMSPSLRNAASFVDSDGRNMIRITSFVVLALLALLGSAAVPHLAVAEEQIYGSQMMTPDERNDYQSRMRSAGSDAEREQIRAEHHERMRVRAEKMGVDIPDEPPARGMGQGKGMGQGMGRGQGQGMGMGRGQGSQGGGRGGR